MGGWGCHKGMAGCLLCHSPSPRLARAVHGTHDPPMSVARAVGLPAGALRGSCPSQPCWRRPAAVPAAPRAQLGPPLCGPAVQASTRWTLQTASCCPTLERRRLGLLAGRRAGSRPARPRCLPTDSTLARQLPAWPIACPRAERVPLCRSMATPAAASRGRIAPCSKRHTFSLYQLISMTVRQTTQA